MLSFKPPAVNDSDQPEADFSPEKYTDLRNSPAFELGIFSNLSGRSSGIT
jgi:hypothetical protein